MTLIDKNFHQNGYCLLESAISVELRDFITQYVLFDEIQDLTTSLDIQVPAAHSKYADPAMEALLIILQPIVEQVTGFKLHPTYSYFRVYRPGDVLEKHTDRESCEISITLCFNYTYDLSKYQWPIFMEHTPIIVPPGGCAIYKGCEVEHWREEFAPPSTDDWHVQGFFHYVNADGPFAEFENDKRPSLGELREPKKENINKSYITFLK